MSKNREFWVFIGYSPFKVPNSAAGAQNMPDRWLESILAAWFKSIPTRRQVGHVLFAQLHHCPTPSLACCLHPLAENHLGHALLPKPI